MSRSNPWKSKPRSIRHTTLIVVEGDTERAFVNYIKGTYGRSCGTYVTIKCAYGGSGDSILRLAINNCAPFDTAAVLYDGDRPPKLKGLVQKRCSLKIQLLVSQPSIEGTFLNILGKTVPAKTEECKKSLRLYIPDSLTKISTFKRYFPKALLEKRIQKVEFLKNLLALFNH